MSLNPDLSDSFISALDSTGQAQASQKKDNKGRKFFQQMQPTFSIDVPTTTTFTKLEFLDNFDPAKDTVVRKKAREWVNKNREISNPGGQGPPRSRSKNVGVKTECEGQKKQLARRKATVPTIIPGPPKVVGPNQVDPFGILPNIGRDFDHIIKYCKTLLKVSFLCILSDMYSSFCQVSRRNSMLGWYVMQASIPKSSTDNKADYRQVCRQIQACSYFL